MAIFQKYEGGAWYVYFRYRDQNGKVRRFRRSTGIGTTKRQAQKIECQWKQELEARSLLGIDISGQSQNSTTKPATFSGFAKHWYDTYVKPNNKRTEIVKKETLIRVHLVPALGDTELTNITPEHISKLIAVKNNKGLSPKTINNILGCLRTMLNTAIRWDYLNTNPVNQIKPLKVPISEFDYYDPEETERFLATVRKYEPKWYPFFLTALRTGMRIGEIFALRWEHIDFGRNTIRVQENFDGREIVTPKGGRSREVPMSTELSKTLEQLQGKRKELVFPYKDGTHLTRSRIKWPFWRMIEKSGLHKIRLHDMRHSFASQLVTKGVHLRTVQQLLGHADIRMTERYAHLAPSMSQDAVNLLDSGEG